MPQELTGWQAGKIPASAGFGIWYICGSGRREAIGGEGGLYLTGHLRGERGEGEGGGVFLAAALCLRRGGCF
jgi:hypothetical protein